MDDSESNDAGPNRAHSNSMGKTNVSRRVLVAEANDTIRASLVYTLQNSGHSVDQVSNRKGLLEAALCKPYDVIVANAKKSHGDGLSVTGTLRHLGISVPVVIVSTFPDWDVFARAQLLSSTCVVSMPLDGELLNDIVSNVSASLTSL